MTNLEWKEYNGSDEQIAEMGNSVYANGFITRNGSGMESSVVCSDTTAYWIIPDDPLREMKMRWSQTGQPVWIRVPYDQGLKPWKMIGHYQNNLLGFRVYVTPTPERRNQAVISGKLKRNLDMPL